MCATAGTARADRTATAEAAKTFTRRCTACHTFGRGVKVGPDLKGVTARRPRAWLIAFVRNSQELIDAGDPTATALFREFKQQRMPAWSDLSEEQVGAILDWLAANGPEEKPVDERHAELATPLEIERGRQLFLGEVPFAAGGAACAACHAVREDGGAVGGTLARELTTVHSRYGDRALALFLRRPCSPREPTAPAAGFLAPGERYAIRAFLRAAPARAARLAPPSDPSAGKPVEWPSWSPAEVPTAPRGRRDEARDSLVFASFPYAAGLVFLLGLAARHALARRRREPIAAQGRAAWELLRGSRAWRLGLAGTAVLHLLALLVPGEILAWNRVALRLYLLEGAGVLLGLLALAGWARLMWSHLGRTAASRAARASELADCVALSLVFAAIASGLATAVAYRWSSSWSTATLWPYVASLARGEPRTDLIAGMPFAVKLHVLTLFALLAALPFTRAGLIAMAALQRLLDLAGRPLAAGASAARTLRARVGRARWIWPEEDLHDAGEDPLPAVDDPYAARHRRG